MLPLLSRAILRQAPRITLRQPLPRRLLTTAPPHQKSRSWRNSIIRWGIAAGGLYYYNISSIFAEEPPFSPSLAHPTTPEETSYPTLDSIKLNRLPKPTSSSPSSSSSSSSSSPSASPDSTVAPQTIAATTDPRPGSGGTEGGMAPGLEETEEEATQEGAFNEETGEINWDCPCLGGMAHGPCGEQFREAFSCFVFSKEEPKGMDCIERFKGMQDCFRLHPDIYGDELANPEPPEDDEPGIAGAVDAAVEGVMGDAPEGTSSMAAEPLALEAASPNQLSESSSKTTPPESLPSPKPSETGILPTRTTDSDDIVMGARTGKTTKQLNKEPEAKEAEELVPKE